MDMGENIGVGLNPILEFKFDWLGFWNMKILSCKISEFLFGKEK